MTPQLLKTLRTIVKYRKMRENIKSIEISAHQSKIIENEKKQQLIFNVFNQNHICSTTDSGNIVASINYYQKKTDELQASKKDAKILAVEAQKLLADFQSLYVERKVAENILEGRSDEQKQSVHRRLVRLYDELGLIARG